MARTHGSASGEVKSSALWGTGNRGGEHRSSALWGTGNRGGEHRSHGPSATKGRRGFGLLTVVVLAMALPMASAAGGNGKSYVAPGGLQAAGKGGKVDVVIQAAPG